MRLPFFCACFLLFCHAAIGQDKKVPAEGEGNNNETDHPQIKTIAPEGIPYTQVTLWGNYADELDTQNVHIVDCYPDGKMKTESNYVYTAASAKDNEPGQRISKVEACTKKEYSYDAQGNVTHTRSYEDLPANSIGGVRQINAIFYAQYAQEQMAQLEKQMSGPASRSNTNTQQQSGENAEKEIERRGTHFLDSTLKSHPKNLFKLLSEEFCSYDKNGNPVYREDTVKHSSSSYIYTYTDKGQVGSQKELYKYYNKSSLYFYNTRERVFNYDGAGRLTSINSYVGVNDSTSDIAIDNKRTMLQKFHYNDEGLLDTLSYIQGGTIIKHIIAYSGDKKTNYTILRTYGSRTDTTCYYAYKYKENNVTEINFCYKADCTHLVYDYNNAQQPIEQKTFVLMPANRPEQIMAQQLFYYGNNEDKTTAKRSLWVQPRQRSRNIQPVAAEIYTYVEQMPAFNGDINVYVSAHIKYPEKAKAAGVEGRVIVKFVVLADGSLSDISVIRGIGYGCDEEAMRVIKNMPKWKPGKQNGKAVAVNYTLPLSFKL